MALYTKDPTATFGPGDITRDTDLVTEALGIAPGAELIGTLGGVAGFGENMLSRNDDRSSDFIDVSGVFENGLNFFGETFTGLYVNNNGSVTFDSSLSTFTPSTISGGLNAGIFAYWGDVDTRGGAVTASPGGTSQGTNLVYYDLDEANGRFTATWDDVGYFSSQTDRLNAFQMIVTDASDDAGRLEGDFDIQFRYEDVDWTAGSASGGSGGLGGTTARAGYSAGNDARTFFELPQAGDEAAMRALDETPGNTGEVGVWNFEVRNGAIPTAVTIGDGGFVLEGNGFDFPLMGDGFFTPMSFTVERFGNLSTTLDVEYIVTGGASPAAGPDDIVGGTGAIGSVSFAEGQSTATIQVDVIGDTFIEPDETVVVTLTDAVSSDDVPVIFGARQGTGIILDDDNVPPPPPFGPEADIWGDPHLTTLDGLGYDFQAVGEFTLIEATSGDPLSIQVRTAPINDIVSVNVAMATLMGDSRVVIDARGDAVLTIDGSAIDLANGGAPISVSGGQIFREGDMYTLVYANGEQVKIGVTGDFINVCALLSGERDPGTLQGLLGNADGETGNDLALRDGTVLTQPVAFDTLYGVYADSWRISEDEALFDRAPGETTADFQDASYPRGTVTLEDLPASVVASATALVDAAGITNPLVRDAAILDIALTGRADFAAAASNVIATPDVEVELTDVPVLGPTIGISRVASSQPEGDAGITALSFDVYRLGDSSAALDVSYSVFGDVDAADFGGVLPTGTVSFGAGDTEQRITLSVSGDEIAERDETLGVRIDVAPEERDSVVIAAQTTQMVIANDDGAIAPVLSIALTSIDAAEGTGAPSEAIFTITREGSTLAGTTVDVSIAPSPTDPASGADFVGGEFPIISVAFLPGETTRTVTVEIEGDSLAEANEGFGAILVNAVGATIAPDRTVATAIIIDDDDAVVTPGGIGLTEQNDRFVTVSGDPVEVFAGGGADVVIGAGGADILAGGGDGDLLRGGLGEDILMGGAGGDTMTGGGGADEFVMQASAGGGVDFIEDYEIGTDTIVFAGFTGTTSFDALAISDTGVGARVDYGDGQIMVVRGVTATELTDTAFRFDAAEPAAPAAIGADIALTGDDDRFITQDPGANRVSALGGNDVVSTANGADVLVGGDGDDSLKGGGGGDRLVGGVGGDTLEGGSGADTFAFDGGEASGVDFISDFEAGVDTVELSGFTAFDSFADLSLDDARNGDALLDLGEGRIVVFTGVSSAAFGTGDFDFA